MNVDDEVPTAEVTKDKGKGKAASHDADIDMEGDGGAPGEPETTIALRSYEAFSVEDWGSTADAEFRIDWPRLSRRFKLKYAPLYLEEVVRAYMGLIPADPGESQGVPRGLRGAGVPRGPRGAGRPRGARGSRGSRGSRGARNPRN